MGFNKLHKILTLAVFFFSAKSTFSHADSSLSLMDPAQKSQVFYKELYQEGFAPSYSHISPVKKDNLFPENIVIQINGSADSSKNKSNVKNIIFTFSQDFYEESPLFIKNFIKELKKNKLPYNSTILLTASQCPFNIEGSFKSKSPAELFIESLYETSSTAAICIQKAENKRELIYGANGKLSPLWLVNSIHSAFKDDEKKLKIKQNYIYKIFSDSKNDSTLSLFLEHGIAASQINLFENDEKTLVKLASILSESRSSINDYNYTYINFFSKGFFVNENVSLILFITFSIIILLKLCFEAFSKTSKDFSRIKNLKRTVFLIPVYIFLTSFFIYISLKLSSSVIFSSLLSITFMLILFMLQMHYNFFISFSGFAFQMLICGAVNIFLFSSFHFSLMYFFFFEYLVIFISSKQKNTIVLILCFMLLLIPGLHLVESILEAEKYTQSFNIKNISFLSAVILSSALFPLQLLWLRIIMRMRIIDNSSSIKKIKTLSGYALAVFITTAILSVSVFFTKLIFFSNTESSSYKKNKDITITEEKEPGFSVKTYDSLFYGIKTGHIIIESPSRYIRYQLVLENENSSPVFNSNFNYEYLSSDKILFIIPDYPDCNLEIIYSGTQDLKSSIKIDAWKINEKGELSHEWTKL